MILNFCDSDSSFGICVQDFANEVLAVWGEKLWHLVVGTHDFLVQIGGFGVLEGKITSNHGIKDNSTTPDIRLKTMISFACDHLRSSIAWGTTGSFQSLTLLIHVGETEVDNFERVVIVEKQILRL